VDIGLPPVIVLGYPMTMVLGEKLVTAIGRGGANTRWRDFGDLYRIINAHSVNANGLRASMRTIADYRQAALSPLLPALAAMPDSAQARWARWRSRTGNTDLPEGLSEVLEAVSEFADPVIRGEVDAETWDPASRRWEQAS
jgi:hypothetical protein